MDIAQHHRGVQERAHAQKSMWKPVWTGKRDAIIDGSHKEISWCLQTEKDTKISIEESLIPSWIWTWHSRIQNKHWSVLNPRMCGAKFAKDLRQHERYLRWSGRRDFAHAIVWMLYAFFPCVYAVFVTVDLFVCIVTCEEVGRWILFKCNTNCHFRITEQKSVTALGIWK